MPKNKETAYSLIKKARGQLDPNFYGLMDNDITSSIRAYGDFYQVRERLHDYFNDIGVFMPNPAQNEEMQRLMMQTFEAYGKIQRNVGDTLAKLETLIGDKDAQ
jgi:hypothetical protein